MKLPARPPVSTYRLQLHRGFTFDHARALVPYLARLGITDLYLSPYLKASPGSLHGYDICDHNELNPEIGDEASYFELAETLRAAGMGQILDFVPNHMAADAGMNHWWRDVLDSGSCSRFATFFDIDWNPLKEELRKRVLLPILGDQYGLALERGELRLQFEDGCFRLRYFDQDLPVNPRPASQILRHRLDSLEAELAGEDHDLREYLSIITALERLPPHTDDTPEHVVERQREKEIARERLARLADSSPRIRRHVEENVEIFNGEPGRPESFDLLHRLLEAQPYRVSYWRTAPHEINYRRFFDINQLAGLRMEDPVVFEATHGLVLRLIREGHLSGLRLDHIDGLFDPAEYLSRLQAAARQAAAEPGPQPPPDPPFYVVIEKILSASEELPTGWPVHGTSGYDFLNEVNGLFVDAAQARRLRALYERFTRQRASFADIVYASKKDIMGSSMASELNVLARALNRMSEQDRRTRDFTLNSLREALQEVVACFPVYRTYVNADGWGEGDRVSVDTAIEQARRRDPTMEPLIFDFVRSVLLPERNPSESEHLFAQKLQLAMKFQQYTGPVQAKGVEDTAFYRWVPLLSLNEVGGEPERFGRTPEEFHAANSRRARYWPLSMLGTSTHDTKRGEDGRARIDALSEVSEEWGRQLTRWARTNAANRSLVEGQPAPDRNDEYLFYQALVGAWPADPSINRADGPLVERLKGYMLKAVREAKLHTSWIIQNPAYEEAVARFVERTLAGPTSARFLPLFLPFQQRVARLGAVTSMAQVVLKIASPGVPDFYQGTELWNLSLVDPDNRRPVDYDLRSRVLDEVLPLVDSCLSRPSERCAEAVRNLLEHWPDGRIKLFLTACGLRLRRQHSELFLKGDYLPLAIMGSLANHVVAFARLHEGKAVLAVVARLAARLTETGAAFPVGEEVWEATRLLVAELPHSSYRNALTGETLEVEPHPEGRSLPVGRIFALLPVALLVGQ